MRCVSAPEAEARMASFEAVLDPGLVSLETMGEALKAGIEAMAVATNR